MIQDEILKRISDLEREIALLPAGSITKKNVNNKEYYYHRVSQDGKRTEKYIALEDLSNLREQIEKRKELEKELKSLKAEIPRERMNPKNKNAADSADFKTLIRIGDRLASQVSTVKQYKKRECFDKLKEFVFGGCTNKVFILYGLRRTGKTTMIRQVIAELPKEEFEKAAFIQVQTKNELADLDADLRMLESRGFKYIFIDEVTLIEDFVEGAAIFADIYASSGMKIVLSGTDSLGFAFSKEEQLYDRCVLLHTTLIPYREFDEVLGISGIDEYIRYGGTMSLGGINYNADSTFSDAKHAEEYIDTAIAKNIQHSLRMYQYGGHFRQLLDLHERGELTNVINRVVENINHSFTRSVVEQTFKSHDISLTAANLLKDREKPINIKEHMNLDLVTRGMMDMLDILNKEEQSIDIEESHMVQIKQYLELLDLIKDIDLEFLPDVNQKGSLTVITQPGLRYAQAEAITQNLLLDEKFSKLSAKERQRILERLLNEIRGRMMEEIILLETKEAMSGKHVFKLQFAIGEFDMVVADPKELTCEIYEFKYSTERVPEQYHHLIDEEKCALTSHRFGDITGRYVIYRGDTAEAAENAAVKYLNVEEYLKSLKRYLT